MPFGPFSTIGPRALIRAKHVTELQDALENTPTSAEVTTEITTTVTPLVADALASDPVVQSAVNVAVGSAVPPAVTAEVAGRNILEGAVIIQPSLVLRPSASANQSGTVTPTNVGTVTTTTGEYGSAWAYTTTSQRMQVTNTGGAYINRTTGTIFVRAMFPTALAHGQSQPVLATSAEGFRVTIARGYTTTTNYYVTFGAGSGLTNVNTVANAVPNSTFVTLCLSWENGNHWGYVDGVLMATGTHTIGTVNPTTINTGVSSAQVPYQVESHLYFPERLPIAQIAELSALMAAHTIDTDANTGVVTVPGVTVDVVPLGGSGATAIGLQSPDNTLRRLTVDNNGILSVGGVAVAYRSAGVMSLVKSGTSLSLSTTLPAGVLRQDISLTTSSNGTFSFVGSYLAGALFHATGDDTSPLGINTDTVGGNHGWTSISSYVVAGHAKVTADLGSIYTDGTRNYTLLQISGTTLVFGHPYTEPGGVVYGGTTPPSTTLTHVSGGTNTGSAVITTPGAITQLRPAVRDVTVTAALDGLAVTSDGTYAGDELVITEQYTILDYKSIIDWAQSHIGTSFEGQAGVDGMLRVDRTYTFAPDGSCVIATALVALRKQVVAYYNAHQSAWLDRATYTLKRHMPGVISKSGYDFGATEVDMTAYATTITYGPSDLVTVGQPPSWYADWLYSGASRWIGFAGGILPDKGSATDAIRATDNPNWDMRSTKKVYTRAVVNQTLEAGDLRDVHTFRAYLDPNLMAGSTALARATDASGDYLMTSYLTAQIGTAIPEDGVGRPVTTIKGAGLTATSSVTGSGVVVSVPSAGHATLKVS